MFTSTIRWLWNVIDKAVPLTLISSFFWSYNYPNPRPDNRWRSTHYQVPQLIRQRSSKKYYSAVQQLIFEVNESFPVFCCAPYHLFTRTGTLRTRSDTNTNTVTEYLQALLTKLDMEELFEASLSTSLEMTSEDTWLDLLTLFTIFFTKMKKYSTSKMINF